MIKEQFWEKFMQHEVVIHTPTKKQFNAFIRLCTDRGIAIGCTKQEQPLYNSFKENTIFLLSNHTLPPRTAKPGIVRRVGTITEEYLDVSPMWVFENTIIPIVEFSDIFSEANFKYHPVITISCDGKTTVAQMIKRGKIVKETSAKCNPKDDFNYQTGVKLAIDRLFSKPYHIVKQDHYEVGDKVKIVNDRTRGMNEIGLMDHWLGKVMTIRSCDLDYRMKEDIKEWRNGWFWQDEMIEGKVVKDE